MPATRNGHKFLYRPNLPWCDEEKRLQDPHWKTKMMIVLLASAHHSQGKANELELTLHKFVESVDLKSIKYGWKKQMHFGKT